jgi:hypothetical protein
MTSGSMQESASRRVFPVLPDDPPTSASRLFASTSSKDDAMKHPMLCVVVVTALLAADVGVSYAQWHPQSSGTTPRTTNGVSDRNLVQTAVRQNVMSISSVGAVHGRVAAGRGDNPVSPVLQTSHGKRLAYARLTRAADMFYLPDTMIVYTTNDTARQTYTYDASGNILTYLEENWGGTQWVHSRRWTNTFDGSGNMLTVLRQHWDGTQWVDIYRLTFTYDASGNELTRLSEDWDGAQWVNSNRTTSTYDASGNRLTYLWEYWDGTQWGIDWRWTSTYDASGNVLASLQENWDGTQWVSDYRWTSTYDASGNLLTDLGEQWDGRQWVNTARYASTYDASGNMLTWSVANWSGTQWVNDWRLTWTYDASGNVLASLQENWDGTEWVNNWRWTITYGASGNVLTELREGWDGTQWVNDWHWTYTYDASGNISLFYSETWSGSAWVPMDVSLSFAVGKNYYSFSGYQVTLSYREIITSIAAQQEGPATSYELAQNYPNPFNPSTTIRYGLPQRSHVTLAVFNTLGQQVATLVQSEQEAGNHEAAFDASGLASGVYLYRLQAGDFVQTKRFVLLR